MGKYERQAYLKAIKERYRKANRAGKARILDYRALRVADG